MDEIRGKTVPPDSLDEIHSWLNAKRPISFEKLRHFLESDADLPELSMSQLNTILTLTEDQACRWEVEWLFSPAVAPSAEAEGETEGWKRLHSAVLGILVANVPDIGETLEERRRLRLSALAVDRSVAGCDGRPIEKARRAVVSFMAQRLYNLGAKETAMRLYNAALYPSGTVGRS